MRVRQFPSDEIRGALKVINKLFLPLLLLFGLGASPLAQTPTAEITGEVSDEAGAALPGAQVTVRNVNTNAARSIKTDDNGRFLVPQLPPGEYEIKVEQSGFNREIRQGVVLTVGREAVVNFSLKVGSISEQVVINQDASPVNTTSSEISALIPERTIKNLPLNGRDLLQLATLQIGVVNVGGLTDPSIESGTGANKLSINGGRIDSNNFMLDGASVNEAQNTTPGSAAGGFVGVDAVQEFQLLTNNYSAEYGGAGGGIVNIVSKSGSNELHGTLFEFLRNSVFDARNFFDREEVPPFKRNQFGGSVGGPIRKDRTFIFGAYEGLQERLAKTQTFIVPTAEARQGASPSMTPYLNLYPLPNAGGIGGGQGLFVRNDSNRTTENFFAVRADHRLSDDDNFFARYTFDDAEVVDHNGIITDAVLSSRNQYAGMEETHIFSPALVNSARFAYNRSFVLG
ncbi:MAG: carboxypeptidase regulatory-like domain-containing protein, partial [Pyrinomonadaceae bacterium]